MDRSIGVSDFWFKRFTEQQQQQRLLCDMTEHNWWTYASIIYLDGPATQYVAWLAAVQQVSSGKPHNTWTVQRREIQ